MKTITFLICLFWIATFISTANAQSTKDEVTIIQTAFGKEKRDVVMEYMKIPKVYADSFWKTYESYEAERKALGKHRIELINEYNDNFQSMTEEKADKIATQTLDNNVAYEQLYKTYYKKFKGASTALIAAKFIQLEIYIQVVVRSAVLDEIPFLGDLGSTNH